MSLASSFYPSKITFWIKIVTSFQTFGSHFKICFYDL